ncbi:DUF397 domain-containing protein [Fodinicola acaciae]|nr:DUF397 domain-containing protein [Fodinicola acaciae]
MSDGPPAQTVVRDSKLGGASPVLIFTTGGWRTFVTAVKERRL